MLLSSTPLSTFIHSLCPPSSNPQSHHSLALCLRDIRSDLSSTSPHTQTLGLQKLWYLSLHDIDIQWAAFTIIKSMSLPPYPCKVIAYKLCSILLTQPSPITLLTTNLLKKDLHKTNASNLQTQLALSCLSTIANTELARDTLDDVLALTKSTDIHIRKQAILLLYTYATRYPPTIRFAVLKLKEALQDHSIDIVVCAVSTLLELAVHTPKPFLSIVPLLYNILKHNHTPWLTIKLIKLFYLFSFHEPRLPIKLRDTLEEILRTTKAKSVQYEVINYTLTHLQNELDKVQLALIALKGFVDSSDRNLEYLGYAMLAKICVNTQTLNKLQTAAVFPNLYSQVLDSLNSEDPSIRSVAITLLKQIVTAANFSMFCDRLMKADEQGLHSTTHMMALLDIASRNDFQLVNDFKAYIAILIQAATDCNSDEVPHIVAQQLMDIMKQTPSIRQYLATMCSMLVDSDASDMKGDMKSMVSTNLHTTENDSSTSTKQPIHKPTSLPPAIIIACAWIIGEYDTSKPIEEAKNELSAGASLNIYSALLKQSITSQSVDVQRVCLMATTKYIYNLLSINKESNTDNSTVNYSNFIDSLKEEMKMILNPLVKSIDSEVSERAVFLKHLIQQYEAGQVDATMTAVELPNTFVLPAGLLYPEKRSTSDVDFDAPFYPSKGASMNGGPQLGGDVDLLAMSGDALHNGMASPTVMSMGLDGSDVQLDGNSLDKQSLLHSSQHTKITVVPTTPPHKLQELYNRRWIKLCDFSSIELQYCIGNGTAVTFGHYAIGVRVDFKVEGEWPSDEAEICITFDERVCAADAKLTAERCAVITQLSYPPVCNINECTPFSVEVTATLMGGDQKSSKRIPVHLPANRRLAPLVLNERELTGFMRKNEKSLAGIFKSTMQSSITLTQPPREIKSSKDTTPAIAATASHISQSLSRVIEAAAVFCNLHSIPQLLNLSATPSAKCLLIGQPLDVVNAFSQRMHSSSYASTLTPNDVLIGFLDIALNQRVVDDASSSHVEHTKHYEMSVRLEIRSVNQLVSETIGKEVLDVLNEITIGRWNGFIEL